MALLRIPDEVQEDIASVATISEAAVEELVAAIQSGEQKIASQEFFAKTATRVKALAPEDAESILEAITNLYHLVANTDDRTREEVVSDVIRVLKRSDDEAVKASVSEPEKLEKRLNRLLSVGSFETVAKAYELSTEHQNVFIGARVLTDLRPVFGHDVKRPPAAFVIVHTLKLNYMDDEQREFYMYLDHKDLDNLIALLARAKDKEVTLRKTIEEIKLPYIDPQE